MVDKSILTLSEFLDSFGALNKIRAIYVDDEKNSIRQSTISMNNPFAELHKHENLFDDANYLVLENGDYVVNKEKIIEDYKDYYVSTFFPKINNSYVDKLNEIDENLSESEYVQALQKYVIECELVLRDTISLHSVDKEFYPKIDSGIDCIVLANFNPESIDEEAEPLDDSIIDNSYLSTQIDILGVLPDDTKLQKILESRKDLYTQVIAIKNGNVDLGKTYIYYTNEAGITDVVGHCNIEEKDIEVDPEEESGEK